MRNILRFIIALVICEGAGIIGALFTTPNIPTWYASLNKPSFNPPNWVFGPVWTLLYLLMAISLYFIWNTGNTKHLEERKKALYFFFAQLVLNTLWSIVFFGMKNLIGGFVVIMALWIMILLTIIYFKRIKLLAGYLLYPYLAWVTFASLLNISIALLNM